MKFLHQFDGIAKWAIGSFLGLFGVIVYAAVFNQFGPVTGILKGSATSYQTSAATSADVIGLWSLTCNSSTYLRGDGNCETPPGTGGGTVNSVALADGSTTPLYTISGSPVTNTGTLTFTLNTQSANCVVAGPTTGSAAQPTCRALVAADLPSIGANPSASIGLSAVNGSASTFMRSDAAPALSQGISPTWTGNHIFDPSSGSTTFDSAANGSPAILACPNGGTEGCNFFFEDITASANRLFIGYGTSTVTGAGVADAGISPGPSGRILFGTANGGAINAVSGSAVGTFEVSDSGGNLFNAGYLGTPLNPQTGNYTVGLSDRGKTIYCNGSSAQTITLPPATFSGGDVTTILANNSNPITIAQGAGVTLVWANGGNTTGNRTVTSNAVVTILFVSATLAFISGSGIS